MGPWGQAGSRLGFRKKVQQQLSADPGFGERVVIGRAGPHGKGCPVPAGPSG